VTDGVRNSSNGRRGVLWAYAPLFLWIGVIFFLSSSNGSMAETSRFIGPLLKFLFPGISAESLLLCHQIIRKLAHVSEYAVLALLACRAFLMSTGSRILSNWRIWAVIMLMVVACLDEFNQSFDAGRTSSPLDVLLDVAGGAIAVMAVSRFRRRRSNSALTR
jgi:VanZ family protein